MTCCAGARRSRNAPFMTTFTSSAENGGHRRISGAGSSDGTWLSGSGRSRPCRERQRLAATEARAPSTSASPTPATTASRGGGGGRTSRERQWGTVREDYSTDGDAWAYFTHDQARSRAYRWGEDGLAGISDDGQRLCFALALWNGRDPILKERLFGLTNREGNHGEDVKEYYFYLDATPTTRTCGTSTNTRRPPTRTTTWSRQTRAAVAGPISSTSCSTPASSTTIATSMSWSSTRRRRRTTSAYGSPSRNRGPEAGDASPASDALVPEYLVMGPRR